MCLFLIALTLVPLLASILASLKTAEEAAAVPPTYFPSVFSFESYERLWRLPGRAADLSLQQLRHGVPHHRLHAGADGAGGVSRSGGSQIPGKEFLFVFLLLALIIPYQALLTPIFLQFAQMKLTNSLVGLAIIHTAIHLPFSLYIMRNSFEAVPRELEEAAVIDGANSWQLLRSIFLPAVMPAIITVSLFGFITSWNEFLGALVMMSKGEFYTLPLVLTTARTQTSLGGTDWGLLQAGVTISIIPCIGIYLLLQRYYVAGFINGAIK